MTEQSGQFIYDAISYPEVCHSQTHPGRMAAIAELLGLRSAPVQRCRVLEIGCAGGGNLVPMAHGLPESSFIGIDLSESQIDTARRFAADLGLENVQFLHQDLMDLDTGPGLFDYIIAHGIYSWVPGPVRDQLLAVCKRHLAPDGVAFLSYNTLPGWHSILAVREMIEFRTRHLDDPRAKVRLGREFIRAMLPMVPSPETSPFAMFLSDYTKTRLARFADRPDWADAMLLHDELSAVNQPVYFHQFAGHAARHGLQYLAEADFPKVMPHDLGQEHVETLQSLSEDVIAFEQYLDFVRDQTFRATLLVHEGRHVLRQLDGDKVRNLYVVSRAQFVRDEEGNEFFQTVDDARWPAEEAITTAALLHLEEVSPQAVHFNALLEIACRNLNLNGVPEKAATVLADDLLAAFTVDAQLVELLAFAPAFAIDPGAYPQMSPVARHQSNTSRIVSNLRQEQIELDATAARLAPFLDGQHDRDSLLAVLRGTAAAPGSPDPADDAEPLTEESASQDAHARAELDRVLALLGRAAVMVS